VPGTLVPTRTGLPTGPSNFQILTASSFDSPLSTASWMCSSCALTRSTIPHLLVVHLPRGAAASLPSRSWCKDRLAVDSPRRHRFSVPELSPVTPALGASSPAALLAHGSSRRSSLDVTALLAAARRPLAPLIPAACARQAFVALVTATLWRFRPVALRSCSLSSSSPTFCLMWSVCEVARTLCSCTSSVSPDSGFRADVRQAPP